MPGTPEETPAAFVTRMMDGVLVAQLIHVIAELGVADALGAGPLPVDDLAKRVGANPDGLYRALRTLATVGIFTETASRTFALTPPAAALRQDAPNSVRAIARMRGGREHWQTWTELGHSIRTGRSAFRHVHGTDLWSYLADHPETAETFDSAMGDNAQQVHAVTAEAYDFSSVKRVVDVGGGHGYLVAGLLKKHPELTAVVFDQEHTAHGAGQVLADAGVRDRAEVVAGDFFASVPPGGDVYVLSRILHDWDDSSARRILGNVRAALTPGAEVIVVDAVVPEGDRPHPAKMADIIMLALNEGRERTEAEFAALFETAGLRHTRTLRPDSPVSLVLAEAAD
ncbi:methyltransferase [Amycolatopsis sp. NPDC059021]|uniref:methyltransferase n=1 Tax=Amycolatopsis sp. NPDC059021 TaxID=3346704 RepID=UPI003670BD71